MRCRSRLSPKQRYRPRVTQEDPSITPFSSPPPRQEENWITRYRKIHLQVVWASDKNPNWRELTHLQGRHLCHYSSDLTQSHCDQEYPFRIIPWLISLSVVSKWKVINGNWVTASLDWDGNVTSDIIRTALTSNGEMVVTSPNTNWPLPLVSCTLLESWRHPNWDGCRRSRAVVA